MYLRATVWTGSVVTGRSQLYTWKSISDSSEIVTVGRAMLDVGLDGTALVTCHIVVYL